MQNKSALFFAVSAVLLFPLSSASVLAGQTLSMQSEMHAKVGALYSFSPSKVTKETRESKSKEMDAFWSEVKDHQSVELPLLRNELANPGNPNFFFADGSDLLISLSQSEEDRNLAVSCLAKVDLGDFQSHQFLMEVHALAVKGTNVTPAALHMLDDPKFQVYLPEHGAYRLDQTSCLLEALLPLRNEIWLPSVLTRLKGERDETAIKSLLILSFYAQSEDADRAIRSVASANDSSKAVREFSQGILRHEKELGTGTHPSTVVEAKLREERRLRMASVSDEAMDDLDVLTGKIAKARTLSTVVR
jgi:hypothetical protein